MVNSRKPNNPPSVNERRDNVAMEIGVNTRSRDARRL